MFIGVKGGEHKSSHPIPSPIPQRIVVFFQNLFIIENHYDLNNENLVHYFEFYEGFFLTSKILHIEGLDIHGFL